MSQEVFGGNSTGSGVTNSSSGFSQLPASLQQAFTQYGNTLNSETSNPAALTSAFTPQTLNGGSTSSLSSLANNAYAPTAANISSTMGELQNPYDSSVISQIDKNAYGADSALNSQLSAAGQFGSNRAALGANDIATTQANNINSYLGGEYNTNMTNALTTLPTAMQTSAGNSINAGLTQQQQALMQSTAPYTALSAYSSLLGNIPQTGGTVSTGTNTTQSLQGLGGFGNNGTFGSF